MKRRFLPILPILALCLGLLPVTALAEGTAPQTLYVGSTTIGTGYWTSSDGGKVWTSQTDEPEGNNYIYYDGQGTLELHNATIQGGANTVSAPYGSGIYALSHSEQPVSLTIKLIGENTITGTYGIFLNAEINASSYGTNATLTITGENNGSLEVSGSATGIFVKSGTGNASLNIEKATVTSSTVGEYAAGVTVQSGANATGSPNISLSVNGGSLTASGTGNSDGILFFVGQSQATGATTSLTISDNAIVRANGGIAKNSSSPIQYGTGSSTTGGIVFDGKNGTVYGKVELQENLEIGEGESLTIPEGSSLNANDNLTNNGTINVEDGGNLEGEPTGGSGTVIKAPTITTPPTNQSVTVGQTASFTVEANGDSLSYQWQQSADNGTNWNNISGATSNSYTTDAATLEMNNYQYQCVVSNSAGSVTSSAATLTVNAATVPVTGVSLDKTSLTLEEGDSETLTAMVEPDDATNKNVTWQSDSADVAIVQNGTVTAVAPGTATITVTTKDGSKTDTCTVVVTHGNLVHTPKQDATCNKPGTREYWTCESCGRHYSDASATIEVDPSNLIIPQLSCPTQPAATYDDGGPFTTDQYGNVYDRWGNEIWHNPSPQSASNTTIGYQLVATIDK